jgi:hypothetical protein
MADGFARPEETTASRKEREENEKFIRTLTSLTQQLKLQADQMKLTLPKLLLKRKAVETQIQSIQRSIENDRILLSVTQARIKSAQDELQYRTQLRGVLSKELQVKQTALKSIEQELNDAKAASNANATYKDELVMASSAMSELRDRIKQQITAKEQEIEESQSGISQEKEKKEEALRIQQRVIQSKISELQESRKNKDNGKSGGEIKREILALRQQEASLAAELQELQASAGVSTNTQNLLNQQQSELANLQGTLVNVENSLSTLPEDIESLSGSMQSSAIQIKDLDDAYKNLETAITDKQKEIEANEISGEGLVKELSGLQSKSQGLQDSMAKKAGDIKNIKVNFITQALQMLAEAVQKFAEGLQKILDEMYETSRNLEVQMGTASRIMVGQRVEAFKSQLRIGPTQTIVTQEEIQDAIKGFKDEFGTILSTGAAVRFADQAKLLGVSVDVLAKAERSFLLAGGEVTKSKFTSEFVKAGLTASAAIKFAAQNANLVAIAGAKYADSLARAAINATKIGVSLEKTEAFADALVSDFEGGLERFSELRAMGVEVDFNRLAAVAGTGTPEEVFSELSSQLGGNKQLLEEIQRNRFLKVAIEKDLGLSIADITKMATGEAGLPQQETVEEKQLGVLEKILQALTGTSKVAGKVLGGAAAGAGTGAIIGTMFGGPGIGTAIGAGIGGLVGLGSAFMSAGKARGGLITGPGTGTSDSILTPLSSGEFVINAESTKRLGVGLLSALNSGATFGPGRATGGLITPNTVTNTASLGIAAAEKGAVNQFVKKTLPYITGLKNSPGYDLTREVNTIFGNVGKYSPRLIKELGKNIKVVPVIGSMIGGLITGYDEYKKTGNLARAFGKGIFSAGMGIGGSAFAGLFTAGNPIAAAGGGVLGSIAGEKLFDMMVGPPKAQGGLITGPGTNTSDNILTPTSPGEFVVNAKATKVWKCWIILIRAHINHRNKRLHQQMLVWICLN